MVLVLGCMILFAILGICIGGTSCIEVELLWGTGGIVLGTGIGAVIARGLEILVEHGMFIVEKASRYGLGIITEQKKDTYYLQKKGSGYFYYLIREKGEHLEFTICEKCYMNYEEEQDEQPYVIIHSVKENIIVKFLLLGIELTEEGLSYEFHIPKGSIAR